MGDASGMGARGDLHLHVAGQGHGVRCPSPCTIVPVPPQSLQQPPGAGCGSGVVSVASVARAAEIDAQAQAHEDFFWPMRLSRPAIRLAMFARWRQTSSADMAAMAAEAASKP